MGAIAAVVNKKGENSVPSVTIMLGELKHRGIEAQAVATPNLIAKVKSTEEIKNLSSPIVLGHNLSRIFPRDRVQPVLGDNFALVFEGHLFPLSNTSEVEQVLEKLNGEPQRNAGSIIYELEGSYAFAIACQEKIIVGRDMFGVNPLYYGENKTLCAIASERKALWALGVENVKSFPPGTLATINTGGFDFQPIKILAKPALKPLDMDKAARRLKKFLLESIRKRVSHLQRIAVAFSGGLDSSVIATLAEKCGKEVHLISVGLEGMPETRHAEVAAKALGMPFHLQTLTIDDVKQNLPKTLWLIEEPDVTKASIALAFYWVAEFASRLRCHVLLAGQGGDELFGGYHRYLEEYAHHGVKAVQNALYQDILFCYERNFQRDNQVCSFHKVELRLPFVDRKVVQFGLSLPVSLKIESGEDALRKRVLRRVAQNLGLPQFIVCKPKKAIQYTTGVSKALKRLARNEGLALGEYVKKVFQTVYPKCMK